jgi:hypothetical protein
MFKDNFKIAGCKSVDDAVEATMILWQDYIFPNRSLWKLKDDAKDPRFLFDVTMRNVDFKLGFPIERQSLNRLMNKSDYNEMVFMSRYESTSDTNVNIKMYSKKPEDFLYDCLVIPVNTQRNPYFVHPKDNRYRNMKKKSKESKYATLIVFSSSEIILSGKYTKNMKEIYNFFIATIFGNRKMIEENLETPDDEVMRELLG